MISAWAILVAVEEGSISLETAAGQPGCTVRHLLSHAGGYAFDGDQPITRPERSRIYSNTGIELAARAVEASTGIPFATYLHEAVIVPLGMTSSELKGSPAHGLFSTVTDLARFGAEALSPTLIAASTAIEAFTVQFPDLAGTVPGVGVFRPCPWGLGFEIHGDKSPHWMGITNSPQTVGHFGGSGTMLWIEPGQDIALIALTARQFDDWRNSALRLWPQLSDAVLTAR